MDLSNPAEIGPKLKWHLEIAMSGFRYALERDEIAFASQLMARRRILNTLFGRPSNEIFAAVTYEQCVRGVLNLLASNRDLEWRAALRTEHSVGCLLHAARLEVLLRARAEPDNDGNCGAEVRRLARRLITHLNAGCELTLCDLARLSVFDTWPLRPDLRIPHRPELALDARLLALADRRALWESIARGSPRTSLYLFDCASNPAILPRTGEPQVRSGASWTPVDLWALLAKSECLSFRQFHARWPGLISPEDYVASFEAGPGFSADGPLAPAVAEEPHVAPAPASQAPLPSTCARVWTVHNVRLIPWDLIRRSAGGERLRRFLRRSSPGLRDTAGSA